MKRLASVLCTGLLLITAASALASTSNVYEPPVKEIVPPGPPGGEPRQGGDTQATATVIGALPYTDSGTTVGYANDYNPACGASNAPDVFYRYNATTTTNNTIVSLCGSSYDTVLFIIENGTEVACNDDFCGLQSEITRTLNAGSVYYFGVDGFSSASGAYVINITPPQPCVFACPPGSFNEGEPRCADGYVDAFNGGCNSTPAVFSRPTCATICGEGGTYLFGASQYRDTDWYQVSGSGSYSGIARDFVLRLFVLTPVCPTSVLSTTTGNACVTTPVLNVPGPNNYLFAGTNVFTGVPCGSPYVITYTGLPPCGATAVESTTWGAIKGLYE